MADAARLGYLAAGLGAVSLGVSLYVLSRTPEQSDSCACDDSAVQHELASLRRRVDIAERNAIRTTATRVARPATADDEGPDDGAAEAPAEDDEDPAEAPSDEEQPRYVGFDAPSSALTVSQSKDGALSVRNTDPALVGEVLTVKAQRADGSSEDVTITVPPVE